MQREPDSSLFLCSSQQLISETMFLERWDQTAYTRINYSQCESQIGQTEEEEEEESTSETHRFTHISIALNKSLCVCTRVCHLQPALLVSTDSAAASRVPPVTTVTGHVIM